MRAAPVQSFGRRTDEPETVGSVVLPTIVMPPIQLPLVLVVDPEGLKHAAEQIQAMVVQAVRDGFAEALADHDQDAPAADVGLDVGREAEPASEQLADLTR